MAQDTQTFDLLPPLMPDEIRHSDKLAELYRELNLRRELYPIWVKRGKIKQSKAQSQIAILKAIIEDYEQHKNGARYD